MQVIGAPVVPYCLQSPKHLLTAEELAALQRRAARHPPAAKGLQDVGQNAQALQLANGVKVTVKPLAEERGSALIRVLIPGKVSLPACRLMIGPCRAPLFAMEWRLMEFLAF